MILLFLDFSVIFIIWIQALYEVFFILLRVSFTEKKFLALVKLNCVFSDASRNSLLNQKSSEFIFTFRSIIYFE